jgi:hypothetical protein
MYSNGNDDDDDDAVPMIELATGPIIVPLLQDTLSLSGGNKAIFSIIAADVSSEYKGKARLCCFGNNIRSEPKKKTEQYRKIRQEFMCFICCYGLVAIIGLVVIFCFVLYPAIHKKKWTGDNYNRHDYYHYHQTITAAATDYSRYNNEGKNFFQKMNDFIFADIGFAGDDDAS